MDQIGSISRGDLRCRGSVGTGFLFLCLSDLPFVFFLLLVVDSCSCVFSSFFPSLLLSFARLDVLSVFCSALFSQKGFSSFSFLFFGDFLLLDSQNQTGLFLSINLVIFCP